MRKERKDEHIEKVLRTEFEGDTLLHEVILEPTSLPELAWEDVDLTTTFLDKPISFPLMINAMTGGTEMTREINRDLAHLAHDFRIPLQVGSQRIALEEEGSLTSFTVVREFMDEKDVVLGNLGSGASPGDVEQAMDMVQADGMGIHCNPSQELAMEEGERDFRGRYETLKKICEQFHGKTILKEVGFGMSEKVCQQLMALHPAYLDVSGAGGTNFMEIEDLRSMQDDLSEFYDWGVPTAQSLLHVKNCERKGERTVPVIASGGLKTASDMIRAMVLGAKLCAMSGEVLKYLLHGGYDYAYRFLASLRDHFQMGLMLLGCASPNELAKLPYHIVGRLAEYNRQRPDLLDRSGENIQ